jgi:hypothetical protein
MHAQLTYFDGPRSPELVAASDVAGRDRLLPAVRALGLPIRVYRMVGADGAEIIVSIADSEQALLDVQKAIFSTELLPGEDATLLPGPDRVEMVPVADVFETGDWTKS